MATLAIGERRPMLYTSSHKQGFTLVEVVVVLPMVVLLIGAMIASIMNLTASSLRSQERSQVQLDVLSALDRMERDIRASLDINPSSTSELRLTVLATDRDPLNPSRSLITASDCSVATSGLIPGDALTYEVVYRKSGSSLVRQVTMSKVCSSAWQQPVTETLISDSPSTSLSIAYSSKSASITLGISRQAGGRSVSYEGTMFARSLNET